MSPSAFKADDPWAPAIMIGDKPMKVSDSAIDSIEVGTALSTVVLLPTDLNRMAKINEYENFALMMQHSVLVSTRHLCRSCFANVQYFEIFTNLFVSLQAI